MAKLGTYYGLCPLIDQKSLLGISEDVIPGCVVVTLGKNMAIKYKLSDQKQLDSWSTKEKLSSPVVFCKKNEKYVAVFNQNFIRMWSDGEKNLERMKKIKFPIALHTIISCEDEAMLVFKNGQVFPLSYALENRKSIVQKDVFSKGHIEGQDCVMVNDKYFVGLLIKDESDYYYLWIEPNSGVVEKIELKRNNFKLNGHLVTNTESGLNLFTIWSDGRMFSLPLLSRDESTKPPGDFFSVIETLSRQHNICLAGLNNNYIAMYGADSNEEGASLQIYNIQFKVTQSRQQFKMYSEGSKLWKTGSTLLLTVGQNLAVVPFHLDTEQLAALVGSHKLVATGSDEDLAIVTEVAHGSWEEVEVEKRNGIDNLPGRLRKEIETLLNEGWSETAICGEIFPKLIENKNDSIIAAIDYFIDIPESILVKLLSYSLMDCQNVDVINNGLPDSTLLDRLLSVSYSDVQLLPNLRTGLSFNEIVLLLKYICFMLSENGHSLPNLDVTKSEEKLIDYGCLLIDSHYQQLLLTKDDAILDNLKSFKIVADEYYACLEEFKKVEPVLSRLKRGKSGSKISNVSLKYSIEKIKLY